MEVITAFIFLALLILSMIGVLTPEVGVILSFVIFLLIIMHDGPFGGSKK